MTRRHGFTLLEMLLALTVSAMLMAGVLAVVTGLGARGLAAAPHADGERMTGAVDAWVRLLREDLANATASEGSENELVLTGYAALAGPERERTHRPARVVYRLEDVAGRRWLVRRQALLDVLSNDNLQRDLVCRGVKRFSLVRTPEAAPPVAGPRRPNGGLWRLRAWTDDAQAPTYDRVVSAEPGGDS
ncbi:MAG: prepilin-type N-terminal cleavage/methylation domain-containing protein [Planctomycetota bacterium]|nr:prepilin-type N-terminal cleavage/methylation domain-containing protein [Planctomycetota bacterium]